MKIGREHPARRTHNILNVARVRRDALTGLVQLDVIGFKDVAELVGGDEFVTFLTSVPLTEQEGSS